MSISEYVVKVIAVMRKNGEGPLLPQACVLAALCKSGERALLLRGVLALKRILIVGCPGAGKSTAARALSEITGLPVIHLDRYHWQPGWRMPDGDVWRATVDALAAEPRWIMDGNYSGTLVSRLARADTLIHLDYSTGLCLWRVLRRATLGWGRVRVDTGPGCPERFNAEFLRFVVKYRRDQRARDMERMAGFDGTVYRFTRPAELTAFIAAQRSVFGTPTRRA